MILSGVGSMMAISHPHLTYMTFFWLKIMNISEVSYLYERQVFRI